MRIAEQLGPETPTSPFPLKLAGPVAHGFKRGSKELGIPTANLPECTAQQASATIDTGIYYGWASVGSDEQIYPMVMSYGWNPYYKNTIRTAEVHIIHDFKHDFYNEQLRVIVAGFIRPELNYSSLDDLIADIKLDIECAELSLQRPEYQKLKLDTSLKPE